MSHPAGWYVEQAARTVWMYRTFEREGEKPPTFGDFMEAIHSDSQFPIEGRMMLRDVFENILLPEPARIFVGYEEEIPYERSSGDIEHYALYLALELGKKQPNLSFDEVIDQVFKNYNI